MDSEEDKILGEDADFEFEQLKQPEERELPQRWWHWSDSVQRRYGLRVGARRQLDRHFISRLPNLPKVAWFLSVWVLLICLLVFLLLFQIRSLTPHYTELYPVEGGIYTEGIVGRVTNFNPIYATTEVDRAVSRLVFANLFNYDEKNRLRPVLAQSLEANERSQQYTLTLKPNLKWHDGEALNADDVVFTIKTIKNPEARSPLRVNWQGVSVDKLDELSVKFTLPASFSPFAANLNLPVLPEHILGAADADVQQLRNHSFNWQPVGSGPFVFNRLVSLSEGADEKEFRIQLNRNAAWSDVEPDDQPARLSSLHLWAVPDRARLTELFNEGRISGGFNLLEEEISLERTAYRAIELKLMHGVYLFFKNSSPYLSDANTRAAVASFVDISALLGSLNYKTERIFGPLLPEHDGYHLPGRPPSHDPAAGRRLLLGAGWVKEEGGWFKNGQKLLLSLTTQKDTPYEVLAVAAREQLASHGIAVELDLRSADNVPLEILQNHNYGDMLIYGLALGGDADVYSYWHSSQIDSNSTLRLNLAEYDSAVADEALEAGRSRGDPADRRRRYADFQAAWIEDLPALALYRFQITYYTLGNVLGPSEHLLLLDNADRFVDVAEWAVVHKRRVIGSGP